jgi:aspartyl-tRNA(Asn)/glutamyl-tRNA(Gln) amidotransferase subunit A
VGFKAPYGRVPALPPFNLDAYCHDGAMGRTVAETALLHNLIQGQHPIDHVSLPALPIPTDLGDVRGMRIALAVTLGDIPVEAEVEANTRTFGEALRRAGALVEEVAVDLSLKRLTEGALVHYGSIMGPSMSEEADPDDPRFMAYTRQFMSLSSAAFERTSVYAGMELETEVHLAVAQVFADHDALVCPTFGGLGLRAGDDYLDGLGVAGQHLDLYIFAALTPVFNVASRHPAGRTPAWVQAASRRPWSPRPGCAPTQRWRRWSSRTAHDLPRPQSAQPSAKRGRRHRRRPRWRLTEQRRERRHDPFLWRRR